VPRISGLCLIYKPIPLCFRAVIATSHGIAISSPALMPSDCSYPRPKLYGRTQVTLPSECVSLNRPGFEDFIHPRHRRGGGNGGIGFIDFQGLWGRPIRVLRHAHDFCTSPASFQVFSLALKPVPRPLFPQEPHALSNPTTPSHHNTRLPPSSSQPSAYQIP